MSNYKSYLHSLEGVDKNIRIAFVVGEFNREYTKSLEEVNIKFCQESGFNNIDSFVVPGAFEIPGFVGRLIGQVKYDLIVALAVIIEGGTPHFDYICTESARGLMDLTINNTTPIINGILTCHTEEQVIERITHAYALAGLNLVSMINQIPNEDTVN